jgi:hypothetical protein
MIEETRKKMAIETRVATTVSIKNNNEKKSFCKIFNVKKNLVIGAPGNGLSNSELVSTLAKEGILYFFNADGIDLKEIDSVLSQLSNEDSMKGRFGVSLTYQPDNVGKEKELIDILLKYSVRYLELRDYSKPSEALSKYRIEGGLDSDGNLNNKIILRINDAAVVDKFMDASCFLTVAKPTNDISLISAVCIDLKPRHMTSDVLPSLMSEVRDKRDAYMKDNPGKTPVFLGASGLNADQCSVKNLSENEIDFAVVSTVFLLSKEAGIDEVIKKSLRSVSHKQFNNYYDWWMPELKTSSFCYVEHNDVISQLENFQSLYVSKEFSIDSLIDVADKYRHSGFRFLEDDFFDGCQTMSIKELRSKLRKEINKSLFPEVISCDENLAEFNQWLDMNNVSSTENINALELVNLLSNSNGVNQGHNHSLR